VVGRPVWQRMQAGAFGWAVNEATGFKKAEKEGKKAKCCVPGLPPRVPGLPFAGLPLVSPACLFQRLRNGLSAFAG